MDCLSITKFCPDFFLRSKKHPPTQVRLYSKPGAVVRLVYMYFNMQINNAVNAVLSLPWKTEKKKQTLIKYFLQFQKQLAQAYLIVFMDVRGLDRYSCIDNES